MPKRPTRNGTGHKGVSIKSEKRLTTWPFLLAFILGTIFGELTSDPISDFLFFLRESQGPMSAIDQLIYWFYIPTTIYFGLFILALILSWTGRIRARWFIYILIIFAGVSMVLSMNVLGWNAIVIILLLIPFLLLIYILERKTTIRTKRHGISV